MQSGWRSGPRLPGTLLETLPTDAAELVETLVDQFAKSTEDEARLREIAAFLMRAKRQTIPTPIADPANGARVPRCRACGMPNPVPIMGERKGKRGTFLVCDDCWTRSNPPDPDPRFVPEDYAA